MTTTSRPLTRGLIFLIIFSVLLLRISSLWAFEAGPGATKFCIFNYCYAPDYFNMVQDRTAFVFTNLALEVLLTIQALR